ncbi:hypothetical protein QJ043_03720 [Olsenella sp. YH-ols2217]|uniref:Uncharacterized protein n=1 Tax=Kribbibacterium absianum TaxID=3044210 RepID=A0ABT6ZKK9_9ACTN|nr:MULTISPECIES: hypothetical protein [unclassified Olsenella]MDJ1122826.1 hypothetical protein [Olsenella sp. YH-ols2216]MDJ1129191.1 hypothetical protein [Olsenella sp. YH-ols2217]
MSIRNPQNDRSRKQQTEGLPGMTRKGASRAKPVREAGGSVRVVKANATGGGKPAAQMTKEEKKELKRRERDARDRQVVVSNILLKQSPEYRKYRRFWWVLLGAGLVLTAVAWLCMFVFPGASSDVTEPLGMASVVALVLAYVCIIGAFIFDWVKVRPYRKRADTEVAGMTDKRMQQVIDKDYEEEAAARAAKEEAKKGKRSSK